MSDVYVAFVRDDQSYAEALAVALQGSGLTVSRSSSVVEAISECAAIVVLWTPAAARSKLFVDAADRAFRSGKMVLARMGSDPLPPMFAGTEAHSLSRWTGDPEAQELDSIVFHVDRLASRARMTSNTRPQQEAPVQAQQPRGVVHRFPSAGPAAARARAPEEPMAQMDPSVVRAQAPADPLAEEAAFWRQIQHSNNPGDFYAYLERFGRSGTFAELAETRIGALSQRAAPPPRDPRGPYPPQPQYQQGAGAPPPGPGPIARSGAGFSMGPAPARAAPRPAPQPAAPRLDPHPARARVEAPAPPQSSGGNGRGLAFLIFLAVIGGGGFFAYQQFRGAPPAAVETGDGWGPTSEPAPDPANEAAKETSPQNDLALFEPPPARNEPKAERASQRQTPARPAPVEDGPTPEPVFRTFPAAAPQQSPAPMVSAGDPAAASALLRDIPGPADVTVQPTVAAPPAVVARPPSRPQWAQRASARDLQDAYPDGAARRQIEGRVVLDCLIGADLAVRCRVSSETPSGFGFAAAALRVAQKYRSQPTMVDGRPAAGERASIAFSFKPS